MNRGVPYDHELEYIESTGSQYIDTGVVPTIDTSVEITVAKVTYVTWGVVIGSTSYDNSADRWYFREKDEGNFVFSMATVNGDNKPLLASIGEKVTCRCSKTTFSVGESSVSVGATAYGTRPTRPLFLFSCNFAGSPWSGRSFKGRVYYCKIYEGNTLVQDLIPVSVNGVAMMYDRVTGTFPKHHGTFVAGPVVSTPLMGVHMYGVSDYWFWPKKLVLMPSWNPSSITRPNVDPGLDVWAYRFADNGYAGGVAPDPALISFTSNSVTSENVGGYAEVLFRKFEPGSYKITANRDIPGAVRVLEYAPSGAGYVRSKSILTNISGGGTVAGMFVGKFDVAPHTLTALQFCSAQRGYQSVPGPCTFTDIHIYDYVQ